MFRTRSPGDGISVALRKLLQGGRRGTQAIYKQRLYMQQREQSVWTSKIKYQVKEFSILYMGRCRPLASRIHSFHMHLCYLGPILFPGSPYGVVDVEKAASCLPLAAQQSPWRVEASANPSLGSPHSHLEARNRWWLWHFLLIDMAGDIFISP